MIREAAKSYTKNHLQSERTKYKSYTKAAVVAINDYFSREYKREANPYFNRYSSLLTFLFLSFH